MSKRNRNSGGAACPCGSERLYAQCCEPLHNGVAAADAEALMRSRYSAFALDLPEYIQRSWHGSTRPPPQAGAGAAPTHWLGLQIKRHEMVDAEHARVEFRARYKIGGRAHVLHEISRFMRERGHWFYVDGDILQ